MQRGLQYLTQKVFTRSPTTPVEIIEAFNREMVWTQYGITKHSETPCHFFKACIQEPQFSYCIFFSEHIGNMIGEYIPPSHRNFLIDGTFKIVPQGCFKQLLIIHIDYFEEKVSTHKTNLAYLYMNKILHFTFSDVPIYIYFDG